MNTIRTMGVLLIGTLAVTGCQKGPSEADYDDVAAGVGALVSDGAGGGETGSMADAVAAAKGDTPTGLTAMGSGSYSGVRSGLTYSYSITCQDAAGVTLALCDAARTDTARLTVDWTGSVTLPRFSATVTRSGDWTLSNVQSGTAQLDGTGTFDVDSEFMALYRPVTRTFLLSYMAQYTAVQIRTSDLVVTGGEARYDVHASQTTMRGTRTTERAFDMVVIVTWGVGTVTLVIDGSRRYSVDRGTGMVTRI